METGCASEWVVLIRKSHGLRSTDITNLINTWYTSVGRVSPYVREVREIGDANERDT
jgi:hypothetical protein